MLALNNFKLQSCLREMQSILHTAILADPYRMCCMCCMGSPLFFEHPFRNPFNHEERFRIDLDDHQLRVVTGTAEWAYLRR